ncbi:MAG: integrase DNA-binding domain-containing protein [Coprococcus comes]
MEQKKDLKGRNLKQGESQLKDGRYRYRYTDKYGKRNTVYAWKLTRTDKTPSGKKDGLSLRELEKEIERDESDGILTHDAKNITVYEMIFQYFETKPQIANATMQNYISMVNKNVKPNAIGRMKVADVKRSDIKKFYAYLYKEKKFAVSTIQVYQNIIYPAFQMAVDDDWIRKNPCKDCMKDYVRGSLTSTRYPLTRQEQKALLEYVKDDNVYSQYYTIIAFLLGTGCRISDDDDKIRLNQRKPSKYKGLRRFGPEKNLQRINKFMKERPIFYKNLIQMKENIRFYLRCFYCITKVMILQFNSENRTELARNG